MRRGGENFPGGGREGKGRSSKARANKDARIPDRGEFKQYPLIGDLSLTVKAPALRECPNWGF